MNGDSRERLTSRLAELGQRYLHRTADEVIAMRVMAEKVAAGNRAVLHDVERAAHRIRGSGGMFGFDAISTAASDIEVAATEGVGTERLAELIERLDAQVQAALQSSVRSRGVQAS